MALVMVRLHGRSVAEQPREPRAGLDRDVVVGEAAGALLVPVVPDEVGQVLDQVAAERDVQHLRAAADREHRQVARERRGQQRELGAVALGHDPVRLGMRLLAVQLRVEVGAAGEDQPVERVQRLLDAVVGGRHEQRACARALDRAHVVVRHERRRQLPDAEGRGRDVRRDAHDRLDHRRIKQSG